MTETQAGCVFARTGDARPYGSLREHNLIRHARSGLVTLHRGGFQAPPSDEGGGLTARSDGKTEGGKSVMLFRGISFEERSIPPSVNRNKLRLTAPSSEGAA